MDFIPKNALMSGELKNRLDGGIKTVSKFTKTMKNVSRLPNKDGAINS